MVNLPPNCSFENSELVIEGNTLIRLFFDDEGKVIHLVSMTVHKPTGCPFSRTEESTKYHRWYYRNIRRYRDGRTPRDNNK